MVLTGPDDSRDVDALMADADADAALYAAKRGGRNCVVVAGAADDAHDRAEQLSA